MWRHLHHELDEVKVALEHWKDLAEERSRAVDVLVADLAAAEAEIGRLRRMVDVFASAGAAANLGEATERLRRVVTATQGLEQALRNYRLAMNNESAASEGLPRAPGPT